MDVSLLSKNQSSNEAHDQIAIHQLKASGFAESENDAAVPALDGQEVDKNSIKSRHKFSISGGFGSSSVSPDAFRQALVNTLERRLFYIPSFNIYGGVAGLYDYGPPGCAVKSNVLAFWRQHFVLEEDMLEIDCPCVTPEVVLKASGHVDKFTDLMVKDEKTGTCYRADHLIKDFCKDRLEKNLTMASEKAAELKHVLAVLDDLSAEELSAKIKEYGITAPDTKNPLSDPYPFNLMFQTSIGPSGLSPGYMRPETAQGIFVNFKDLYYYNGNKLPFAAAQIGQAFRNEISPRQGLLRVREFTLAEIEHFVDPDDKSHSKYSEVANLEFLLFPRKEQMSGQSAKRLCLGEAVSKGIVNNETLAYFIGRVYLFLTCLGIDEEHLRFRQHLPNEMAHYAADCWDAEIESSYGWIECVGIADRSAYDLQAHMDKSGVALVAQEKFSEPREVEQLVISPVRKELGLAFKGNQKMVVEALEAMDEKEAMCLKAALESTGEVEFKVCTLGKSVKIKKNMVSISKERKKEHQRVFTPSVIEPSFGIGRIVYCLFEHSFYRRPSKAGNEQLNVFRFPPLVAPIKCTVFPLVQNQQYEEVATFISKSLTAAGISNKKDMTGTSIGKRYARTDELGVPFAVTVDSVSSVTIRERDSKDQIRVAVEEVASIVKNISEERITWADILKKYPAHSSASASTDEQFDVIVIGAGVIGSSTAYQAAKKGQRTLLLEQFDFLHHRGSSHGESRTIRTTYPENYYSGMVIEASQLWEEAESEIGFKVYFKAPQFDMGPFEDKSLQAVIANCQKNSIPHQILDHHQVAEKFSSRIKLPENWIAVLTELGGVLKPTKSVCMFQTLASKHGAILRDNTEVVDIKHDRESGGILVYTASGNIFRAKKCVVTVGAWMAKLVQKIQGISLPIQPLETTVYYWRINEGHKSDFTIGAGFPTFASYGMPYIYGTPALEFPGLIKIAVHGGRRCDPDKRTWEAQATAKESLKTWIKGTFGDRVDSEGGPVMTQSCMYSMTPDEDFVIDFLGGEFAENLVIAGGFSGHGFKMAPVIGKILADMVILGKKEAEVESVLKHFRLDRFEKNPKGNVKHFDDQVRLD